MPLWLGLTFAAGSAPAHEVHEKLLQAQATVIHLTYADGEPYSFERYELFADGSAKPTLTGRTDGQGRIVFLPDQTKRWRVRAFSEDGHGVDVSFEASPGEASVASDSAVLAVDRASRVMLGVLVILALFCALQLFVRRRKPADAATADRPDARS
ncbi:ABC transporter permease [Methylibium sp. Pch-M]|nr:ABC transporter permease [Methylibium sp. Pch-M]